MLDRLFVLIQYVLPQRLISRLAGKLADCQPPAAIRNTVIRWFIGRYGVNMSEALHESPASYSSFNEFFTRPLKPGVRPIQGDEATVVSPVDGAISQIGEITGDQIFQAKGHSYSLTDLLGGDPERARPFEGGSFATIYLAPKDYHRIHMPMEGVLREMTYVPGQLFSVNPVTVYRLPGLFARNERVVAIFDTVAGPMAVIMVGAIIVGSVETRWAGVVAPNEGGRRVTTTSYHNHTPAIRYQRGEEASHFRLGSTVIVVFPKGVTRWHKGLGAESVVRLGEAIGDVVTPAPQETPAPR